MIYLLDTSVLKRLDRPPIQESLRHFAASGRLTRSTILDLEVGYSARTGEQWSEFQRILGAFSPVPTSEEDIGRALQIQGLLAHGSQRGRKIPDLLIAAVAEAHAMTVLHYDRDFDLIASVTGQRCEWIVPAGTVS